MADEERLELSARGSATIIQNIIGGVSGLVALYFIARYVPKSFYGMYAFVLSIYNLYIFLTDLGLTTTLIKKYTENKHYLGDLFGTYITIKIILGGFIVLISYVGVHYILPIFGYRLFDATTELMFNTMLLWIFVETTILAAIKGFMAGNISYVTINAISALEAFLRAVLLIVIALIYKARLIDALSAAYFMLLAFIFSKILNLIVSYHASGKIIVKVRLTLNREVIKEFVSFALPLAISGAIVIVSTNIDKFMIGWIFTSADVGDYDAVQRYARFISNIARGISQIFFVKMAIDFRKNFEKSITTMREWETLIALLLSPAIFLLLVLSDNLIKIFLSNQYLSAASILVTLVATYTLVAIRAPVSQIFVSAGKPWIGAIIGISVNILNVVLNVILIPRLGGFGAALATLISIGILGSLLLYALMIRILNIRGLALLPHLYLFAGAPLVIPAYFLKPYLYRVFTFVPAIALLYLIYLYAIRKAGVLKQEHFEIILGMINIKNVVKTLKNELKIMKDITRRL